MSYYTSQYLDEAFVRQVCYQHNLCVQRDKMPDPQAHQWLDVESINWADACDAHFDYWAPAQ